MSSDAFPTDTAEMATSASNERTLADCLASLGDYSTQSSPPQYRSNVAAQQHPSSQQIQQPPPGYLFGQPANQYAPNAFVQQYLDRQQTQYPVSSDPIVPSTTRYAQPVAPQQDLNSQQMLQPSPGHHVIRLQTNEDYIEHLGAMHTFKYNAPYVLTQPLNKANMAQPDTQRRELEHFNWHWTNSPTKDFDTSPSASNTFKTVLTPMNFTFMAGGLDIDVEKELCGRDGKIQYQHNALFDSSNAKYKERMVFRDEAPAKVKSKEVVLTVFNKEVRSIITAMVNVGSTNPEILKVIKDSWPNHQIPRSNLTMAIRRLRRPKVRPVATIPQFEIDFVEQHLIMTAREILDAMIAEGFATTMTIEEVKNVKQALKRRQERAAAMLVRGGR